MRNFLQFEEKTPLQTLAKIFEASSVLFTVMPVSLSPDTAAHQVSFSNTSSLPSIFLKPFSTSSFQHLSYSYPPHIKKVGIHQGVEEARTYL